MKENKKFGAIRKADDKTSMECADSKLQGIICCFDQFYNVSTNLTLVAYLFLEEMAGFCGYGSAANTLLVEVEEDLVEVELVEVDLQVLN